ncbi:MAG: response regulator, partial [Candidatus Dormibacteraceae bacterium]
GSAALAFLARQAPYATAPRPNLIVLDIRMPDRDGFEILRQVKQNQALRAIPTVVLTTSDAEVDVIRSYELGANEYVTKPVAAAEYTRTVQAIPRHWAKIPPPGAKG